MEEDDDEFYGHEEANEAVDEKKPDIDGEKGDEPMDEGLESGEEEEEESESVCDLEATSATVTDEAPGC